ncbi:MAG: hypothetical protein NC033_01910 [Clostridiales bacterium]|nr:hypothetical protein [Clostridiales bacterium]
MEIQKNSKILSLLYGKKFTYDERIARDENCEKLYREELDAEKALRDRIKDDVELCALLEKLIECNAVADGVAQDLYFTEGFKTGLVIGLEAGEWAAEKTVK